MLIIRDLPYVPGAEYSVTDKDDDQILDVSYFTQFDYSDIEVVLAETPEIRPTASSFVVKRVINDSVEYIWEHEGVYSWKANENIITLKYYSLEGNYPQNASMKYQLSFLDKPWFETEAFVFENGVQLSPLKSTKTLKKLNMQLRMLHYQRYLMVIHLRRHPFK